MAALGLGVVPAGAVAQASAGVTAVATAAAAPSTPLRVTLDTLSPSTIPRKGTVTVTGRIVNRSDETWSSLNVYLVTSAAPIRSRGELARAAATAADAPFGERLFAPGLYQQVGDLAPGQSVGYRLSVKRQDLGISGEPGVYRVGVHVLGASEAGRDRVADGRARTFMPLLPQQGTAAGKRDRTRLALVVPLERWVRRGAAGRLLDTEGWARAVQADGRLDRLLRLTGRARQPVTWALDPAVLDAVGSLAHGNPPLDPAEAPSTGPSSSPSASPSDGGQATMDTGRRWLAAFRREAPGRDIVALPYGSLDVASVLSRPSDSPVQALYPTAARLSTDTLARNGVRDATPGLDPLGGYLPEAALRRADPGSVVIVSKQAFPDADQPVLTGPGRAPVVLTDPAAGSGGPAPNSRYGALNLRQRLISDAALHAMSSRRDQPLVVSTPSAWDPGATWAEAGFFHGLHVPWLDMVDLSSVIATSSPPASGSAGPQPVYPQAQRSRELPAANLRASMDLDRVGGVFDRLLTDNRTVGGAVGAMAMLASSEYARRAPTDTLAHARAARGYVRRLMSRVRVEGPEFVMMSGESGPIQVTLANDLAERVKVGLDVRTPGSDLRIDPVGRVTLGPGRRSSVRLETHSDRIGVHSVVLLTTDADGAPLGSRTQFTVRTSNVSTVVWVVMAGGLVLLLVAIGVRLFRRVRRRKATHGPLLPRHPGSGRGSGPDPGAETGTEAGADPGPEAGSGQPPGDRPDRELRT